MRAEDFVTSMVVALSHGYAMKFGGAPKEGELKTFFDAGEAAMREATKRAYQLAKLSDDLQRATRAAHDKLDKEEFEREQNQTKDKK